MNDDARKKRRGDDKHHETYPPVARANLLGCTSFLRIARHARLSEYFRDYGVSPLHCSRGCLVLAATDMPPPEPATSLNADYSTVGGFSNVWNGAGLGTVHSRPVAPSHGLSPAFSCSPPPR
jgi:hypothetical protein